MTPDGKRVVSASNDGTLNVWELKSGCKLQTLCGHTGFVAAVAVTQDGRSAVSASVDGTIKVWDIETAATITTFFCEAPASCCACANDWTIVAGDQCGGVYIFAFERKAA